MAMQENQNQVEREEKKMSSMSVKKKALIALCALVGVVAIVVTSVLGTVAYLTSSAAVSNVFTIGNVGITMDESKVNPDGTVVEGAARVDTNTYHLMPGKTYKKDPTVHVNEGSEKSYLFVLVRNDISGIADNEKDTIADQLAANGWAKYTPASTGWIYVYVGADNVPSGDAGKTSGTNDTLVASLVTAGHYKLFDSFSIDPDAKIDTYGAAKITLTAVAIQGEGISSIATAWAAVVETYPYIHTGGAPSGT